MTYFDQAPKDKLRVYQAKSNRVRRDRYKLKLRKGLAAWESSQNIKDVMAITELTRDGAYKLIRTAKELKDKGEL